MSTFLFSHPGVLIMKIALGADSYGLPLKDSIKAYLSSCQHEVIDFGVTNSGDSTPYYTTADNVANRLVKGEFTRAILVCGTGMGMSIVANKHPGVYAAVCESTFSAEKSRSINDSNILTLGSMATTPEIANDIVDVWLKTEFTEGWDAPMQDWLKGAIKDISGLENQQFNKS